MDNHCVALACGTTTTDLAISIWIVVLVNWNAPSSLYDGVPVLDGRFHGGRIFRAGSAGPNRHEAYSKLARSG
jgi:hypothetical protein